MASPRSRVLELVGLLVLSTGVGACAWIVGPVEGYRLFDGTTDGGTDATADAAPVGQNDANFVSTSDGGADAAPVVEAGVEFQGTPIVIASNQVEPQGVVVTSDSLYWSNAGDGTLHRIALGSDGAPATGASASTAFTFSSVGAAGASDLLFDGTTIYALVGSLATSQSACRTLVEMPISDLASAQCAHPTNVCSSTSVGTRIAYDANNVYMSNGLCDYVMGDPKPGTDANHWTIYGDLAGPVSAVASDGTRLFYGYDNEVWVQPASGTGSATAFALTSAAIGDLMTDGETTFWIVAGDSGQIQTLPVDSTGVQSVYAKGQQRPWRLAQSSSEVFWTNEGVSANEGSLAMMPKDASQVARTLASGQGTPWGVAVGGSAVYWTNSGTGTVMMLKR